MKLIKVGVVENGVSLEGSQGIPRQLVMWLMWLKSYVCVGVLLPECSGAEFKSLTKWVQSSANFS